MVLHGDPMRDHTRQTLVNAAALTVTLVSLEPQRNRQPYLAYLPRIRTLLKRAF